MALDALSLVQLAIRGLVPVIAIIARHDPDLARQIRRALGSAAGNGAEAEGRIGRDRHHLFRTSYTSAGEVGEHLRTAVSFGYVTDAQIAEGDGHLDRARATLWRLSGR